ncbi:MAG: type sorting protein [Ignavibacteria bacterium]|nr:type sorting protein [Ignavibacteria bacterium]
MKNKLIYLLSATLIFLSLTYSSNANIIKVGAGKTYSKPSLAAAIAADGDTIDIDAGLYSGDVCIWSKNNLTIRGVRGLARLDAVGKNVQGKSIWIVKGINTTIEYIEFFNCTVPDKNGAGIRMEGTDLTLRHCYFHDNEDGILAGDNAASTIRIEFCEFARNGAGDGYSHNLYINHVKQLIFSFNYTHHAKIGHCLKSRAYANYIFYNRIMDEETGNSSYLINLPNGGLSYVIGNQLMKGVNAENQTSIDYGSEGLSNPVNKLYISHNTVVNKRKSGIFVNIRGGTPEAKVINNIFAGIGTVLQGTAETKSNLNLQNIASVGFIDELKYDYHLTEGSPAINAGADLSDFDSTLIPIYEYKHPCDSTSRIQKLTPDLGAFGFKEQADVSDNIDNNHLNIFPNPFAGYCTIAMEGLCEVKITDCFGRIMMKNEFIDKCLWQPESSIGSGIYFVKIKKGDKAIVQKIVISR